MLLLCVLYIRCNFTQTLVSLFRLSREDPEEVKTASVSKEKQMCINTGLYRFESEVLLRLLSHRKLNTPKSKLSWYFDNRGGFFFFKKGLSTWFNELVREN